MLSCPVPLPPWSHSKILSSCLPSASLACWGLHASLLLLDCCSVVGLPQRTASGWAVWSMWEIHQQEFCSFSGCCVPCGQQGYPQPWMLLCVAEWPIPRAEADLSCCINGLSQVEHPSVLSFKLKLYSLWPHGSYALVTFLCCFCWLILASLCDAVSMKYPFFLCRSLVPW